MPDGPMTCRIEVLNGGAVARLILDRPERRNAFSRQLARDLDRLLDELQADRAIRAITLEGEGPAFCVGGDLAAFEERLVAGTALADVAGDMALFNPLVARFVALPLPVVAALHGAVAGGGLALACACDLRVCDPATVFRPAFLGVGLPPDTGSSWLLPRLLGPGRATELLLRNLRLDAVQALAWGLVNEVVDDPRGRAAQLAAELAAGPPNAMAATKALLAASGHRSLDAQLHAEEGEVVRALIGSEFAEGVRAFLEKRPSRFER